MAQLEFISVGANRQPHASDWCQEENLLAYGAGRTIALWDPSQNNGVGEILKGHQKIVTAVKFFEAGTIVSGSSDATVKIWKKDAESGRYKCFHTLTDHSKSVTSLAVNKEADLIVSGSADGSIIFTRFSTLEIIDKKTVDMRFYALCLAIHPLANGVIAVAAGGTLNQVFIFTGTHEAGSFNIDVKLDGHENWIRSLGFKKIESRDENSDILLASASQDRYIRLWRLHKGSTETIESRTAVETDPVNQLTNKVYYINNKNYSITFEALIMGHDDWIFSTQWHPDKLELLSSSADTSAMIWHPDEQSGVWVCHTRLGDVSIKGASTATGASGGFWNALWLGKDSNFVATVGRTGSWRLWKQDAETGTWSPHFGVSGHTKEVTDLSWERDNGDYLLSASLDQTTRLFGTWNTNDKSWHEIARPQIHGYDMIAVKCVNSQRFVSGGDEKTLRVFDEPKGIAYLLENVCGEQTANKESMPDSAMVPALSLSNKQEQEGVTLNEEGEEDEEDDGFNTAHESTISILSKLKTPPLEDHLQRHTLWPEVDKLYGHGYEIVSVDVSNDRTVTATCCKANTENHAVIRLFDTTNWQQLPEPLKYHNLTITRLRFSPDDKYLLSVSRDRTYALWEKDPENKTAGYKLSYADPKAHSRIIWDCAWLPDSTGFATAGRDKSVKLWRKSVEGKWEMKTQVKFDQPVTAIDINPVNQKLAVGLDNGALSIHSIESDTISPVQELPPTIVPDLRVSRISWKPQSEAQFAVASDDTSVRIYSA